jgi:hypothetical protein
VDLAHEPSQSQPDAQSNPEHQHPRTTMAVPKALGDIFGWSPLAPPPPSVKAGDQIVNLLQSIRVETDLVEQAHVKEDADNPHRPGQHLLPGNQPYRPQVQNGPNQLDIAHGIAQHGKRNSVDAQKVSHGQAESWRAGFDIS